MATEYLQAFAAAVKSLLREQRFENRRAQAAPALRGLAALLARVGLGDVELQRCAVGNHASGVNPGALAVQDAPHRRVFADQVGSTGETGARPCLRRLAPRCAHLPALKRVLVGLLPGGFEQADALQRHVQSRRIHHDKHGVQTAPALADEPAPRCFKTHDAGRTAMQTHFFFYALAVHGAARAVRQELWYQKQGQTLGSGRRIGQSCQHQMHDVVCQVVLAAGDKDLAAADLVAAVCLRHGLGADQSQVAAGMRLGQAHGGQPLTRGELAEVAVFQLLRAVGLEAIVGTMQQVWRHGPGVIGGAEHLEQHGLQHSRQTLATVLRCSSQRRPAGLPEGLVGVAKTRRHGDRALAPARAGFVTNAVQRCDLAGDKLAGFVHQLRHQFGVNFCVCWQFLQLTLRVDDLRQHVKHLIGTGFE